MIFTSLLSYGLYGKKALYSVDFVFDFTGKFNDLQNRLYFLPLKKT